MATRQDLRDHLLVVMDLALEVGEEEIGEKLRSLSLSLDPALSFDAPLSELGLGDREYRILALNGRIAWIGELVRLTPRGLGHIREVGPITFKRVVEALEKKGLKLGMDVGAWEPPDMVEKLQNEARRLLENFVQTYPHDTRLEKRARLVELNEELQKRGQRPFPLPVVEPEFPSVQVAITKLQRGDRLTSAEAKYMVDLIRVMPDGALDEETKKGLITHLGTML